jgi:hypothetical protein
MTDPRLLDTLTFTLRRLAGLADADTLDHAAALPGAGVGVGMCVGE